MIRDGDIVKRTFHCYSLVPCPFLACVVSLQCSVPEVTAGIINCRLILMQTELSDV